MERDTLIKRLLTQTNRAIGEFHLAEGEDYTEQFLEEVKALRGADRAFAFAMSHMHPKGTGCTTETVEDAKLTAEQLEEAWDSFTTIYGFSEAEGAEEDTEEEEMENV